MKKEAVITRPIASIETARVGYHVTGTGLVIGFGDFKSRITKETIKASKKQNTKVIFSGDLRK